MHVLQIERFGDPVRLAERPEPTPGPGQVRVRVEAATVNPVDRLVADGTLATVVAHLPLPVVPGWDVVGEIDAVGRGSGFAVGERVAAMSPWFERGVGTWAEAVVLDDGWVAPLPAGVDPVAAATLPLNGLTARQALDLVAAKPEETLLVTGVSGGVGGFAVQLAAAQGVHVVAVASYGDEERVGRLGAAEVLPRSEDLVAATRARYPEGVDAVLDAVPVGPALIGAARDGGTFVTVLDPAVPAAERGVRVDKVSVRPDPGQLAELLEAFADGRLTAAVARRVPLVDAATALGPGSGHERGKIVLLV